MITVKVKNFLSKDNYINADYRENLLQAASQAIVAAQKNMSLSISKRDSLLFSLATIMTLSAGALSFEWIQNALFNLKMNSEFKWQMRAYCALGAGQMYIAASLPHARAKLKAAQEIRELIENKTVLESN
ncbi:hypothetical protein H0X48_04750 [Candidatus Dependentiae bacterium]|nr:hypothetical protein [Candidatus Dependentiae bacterium]